MVELKDEIREMGKEAERMSRHVIPEDSPGCEDLWKDYVEGWVIPEDKTDVCTTFRDCHRNGDKW